jgi:hypothetical protein
MVGGERWDEKEKRGEEDSVVYNVMYGVTAHHLATDHPKKHANTRSRFA